MARETSGDRQVARRFLRRVLLSCAAVFVIGCMQAAGPAHASETGIRGTVLWGPVRPGPARLGEAEEAPLSATFTVSGPEGRVARFESDADGRFELPLPAGTYTIVPVAGTPVPFPQRQTTRVTVPPDGYATVTIRLDTGMR